MSPILNSVISAPQHEPDAPFYRELTCWLVNFVCRQPVFNSGSARPMQSAHQPVDAKSTPEHTPDARTVEQLLEYAKQKLKTPQMPHFMKVTVYLRFCCLAIHKSLSEEQQALGGSFYHDLLQWLWECEPNWWEQCIITDDGITSQNIRIQSLLQPLEDFVRQVSEG